MLGDAPRGFETPVQDLWLADAVRYHVHCVLKSEGHRMLLVSELELVGAPCPGETLWRPRAGGLHGATASRDDDDDDDGGGDDDDEHDHHDDEIT